MGFEIELLAPRGRSRLDLAQRVAARTGGTIRRFFHAQAELTRIEGKPTFQNLTPGFEVLDREGHSIASFVDDLTLVDGLDQKSAPLPGWFRVVTDDTRLVSLLLRNCDPDASQGAVLLPVADIFGVQLQTHPSGLSKVSDQHGVSVAIAAELSGERERGCEIVTPPLSQGHAESLSLLLGEAVREGFAVPLEGALHIHFDAGPLQSARTIKRLVAALDRYGEDIKDLVGTNPNCRRLGDWPEDLLDLVDDEDFESLTWAEARKALSEVGLSKFCDFNLLNIISANKAKHTFEVRVLPVSLDAQEIIASAALFEALLQWAILPDGSPPAGDFGAFLDDLPIAADHRARWVSG